MTTSTGREAHADGPDTNRPRTDGPNTAVSGVPIVLDDVTKIYPGQERPAVDRVSLDLPAGHTTVFVGPSGCGKTTTMRMINRLIEPTSGTITIDGEDNRRLDADTLRRKMSLAAELNIGTGFLTLPEAAEVLPQLLGKR